MREIDLRIIGDSLVIHFRKKEASINVYTLASSLVSFADAAKAANAEINPGYEIEIQVEALLDGSFKAKLKAVYHSLDSLFSKQNAKSVILSIIASYIYQHTLSPSADIKINVNDSLVIIEQGDTKIIIPKNIYDECEKIKKSELVEKNIGKVFKTIKEDRNINSVSFDAGDTSDEELPEIEQDEIIQITNMLYQDEEDNSRVIIERATLHVIKAIFEVSRRKWEFAWNGEKISAPVSDQSFYEKFNAHAITLAPGDSLDVNLKIHQRKHCSGIFINHKFEVVEVLKHNPKIKDTELEFNK